MRDREPTIRSRELGEGLRRAVDKAGLNGVQAAHELGWSTSKVSRLLSGKRGGDEVEVSALLAVCKVKGKERSRLLALCQEQHTPGWFQQHGSRLPKQLVTLIDHENKALAIGEFQAMLVPGLLQTGDYARAVISRSANMPSEEVGTGSPPGWPAQRGRGDRVHDERIVGHHRGGPGDAAGGLAEPANPLPLAHARPRLPRGCHAEPVSVPNRILPDPTPGSGTAFRLSDVAVRVMMGSGTGV